MWLWIRKYYHDSETIFWARLQTMLGSFAMLATYMDTALVMPILPPEILPWFLLFNGLATEYLRRRRSNL